MRACTRCSEGGLTCTRAGLIANLGRSAAHRVLTGDQRSGSGGGRGVAGAGRRGSGLRNSCARALPRPPARPIEHALQRASMNILARARQHHRSASQRHGTRVRALRYPLARRRLGRFYGALMVTSLQQARRSPAMLHRPGAWGHRAPPRRLESQKPHAGFIGYA